MLTILVVVLIVAAQAMFFGVLLTAPSLIPRDRFESELWQLRSTVYDDARNGALDTDDATRLRDVIEDLAATTRTVSFSAFVTARHLTRATPNQEVQSLPPRPHTNQLRDIVARRVSSSSWLALLATAPRRLATKLHKAQPVTKAFGKALVNWNEWSTDPAKALGELVPGIAIAIATAGMGSGAGVLAKGSDTLEVEASSLDAVAAETPQLSGVAATSFDDATTAASQVGGVNGAAASADALRQISASWAQQADQIDSVVHGVNAVGNAETAAGIVQAADGTPGHTADSAAAAPIAAHVGADHPWIP